MPQTLADLLDARRRDAFVGRCTELEALLDALRSESPVVWVHGPGGVGKTTLIRRALAELDGRVAWMDFQTHEASPSAFLEVLGPTDAPPAWVVLDSWERAGKFEHWLRDVHLPTMSVSTTMCLVGRAPPAGAWVSDPGWKALTRPLSLGNFSAEDAAAFLDFHQVDLERHSALLDP